MFTTAFRDARSAISAAALGRRPVLVGSAERGGDVRRAGAAGSPRSPPATPAQLPPHHRQDALVELLGEHLDAIDVSRAGKTVGRTMVRPANPGRLLTAPDSWTVSSVARHGQPPTMRAAS